MAILGEAVLHVTFSTLLAVLVVCSSGAAKAQGATSATAPQPLAEGAIVTGSLEAGGCFSIETAPGSQWTLTLRSEAFDGRLVLARGALCSANVIVSENDAFELRTQDARIQFRSPGGRYLILPRGPAGAVGPYTLTAEAAPQRAGMRAPQTAGDRQQLAEATTATPAADARAAIMRREMAQADDRRAAEAARQEAIRQQQEAARIAAEQAAAAQRAEERRRQRAREDGFNAFLGAAVGVMAEVTNELAAENARIQAETARMLAQDAQNRRQQQEQQAAQAAADARAARDQQTRDAALAAERRAQQMAQAEALRERQAQTQLAQAQNRQQQTSVRQSFDFGGGGSSGGGSSGGGADSSGGQAGQGQPQRIEMLEAVVVCPLSGERLFGELTCFGPFQNTLSDYRDPGDIALACGSSGMSPRDFGESDGNRVWGCGFGLNPTRAGRSPNHDMAERFGLTLPERITYRCTATTNYCRDQ